MCQILKIALVAALEAVIGWLVARWLDDHFDE